MAKKRAPVAVGVHDRREVAVGGRERPPHRRGHARVARFAAGRHERAAPEVLHEPERRQQLGHRHLDHRAGAVDLPLAQRGGDRERGGEPRDLVGHRVARRTSARRSSTTAPRRCPTPPAPCRRTRGGRRRDRAAPKPTIAQCTSSGCPASERGGIGAAPHGGVAAHVVHDARRRRRRARRSCARPSSVLRSSTTLRLPRLQLRNTAPMPGFTRGPRSRARSPAGRFDLHDVGAEVGEEQRAVGPGDHRREVDDAHAVERESGHRRSVRGRPRLPSR